MKMRPTDENGDILPVLSGAVMASGPEAVVALVRDRLNLLAGEWWENRSWGNRILEMMRSSRLAEADVPAVLSYLTSYILGTSGVLDVRDVSCTLSGRGVTYSCKVVTESGSAPVSYEF